MSKPVIGVMPLWDDEKDSLWMLPGYLDGIRSAGGLPVIFPFLDEKNDILQLADTCDGFLFTGGHDVSPSLYHEKPLDASVLSCPKRDSMENIVLWEALRCDKPVLGICRGIQFINAALGGTLHQDLPQTHPSDVEHHQAPPYDRPVHEVALCAGTPLADCLGAEKLAVNSLHHQAVRTLAPSLQAMAVSPDGLIEALYKPDQTFLWAVQWHPEFAFQTDRNSQKVFEAFVRAAADLL